MKKIIFAVLALCIAHFSFSQTVNISVDAASGKIPISPNIFGANTSLSDAPNSPTPEATWQMYLDAGLRMCRLNGGNNATKYNWRLKITSHPDWYNNVYRHDWDYLAQTLEDNMPNACSMFAFQLLGKAASNTDNNFDDWGFNQSQYWEGVGQNLAGGGVPNTENPGDGALVEGDIDKYLEDWPADSTVGILNKWFGNGGLGLNTQVHKYWNMDNEPDIWNGTHDDVMSDLISSSEFMDHYISVAKKARALFPGIKLCGPVTTSEWQWYKWGSESIVIDGKYYCWLEYFIKRLADEEKATGIRLLDVVDLHNYPYAQNGDVDALQLHRMYYDTDYDYPGANGLKTINGGWDNSLTKEYIFKRINDWLDLYFGEGHGITVGISEWSPATSEPNATAVVYASHLGTFADNGVEYFTPWNWFNGMWETLHLYSRYSQEYRVQSTSSLEEYVSAYSSVNANADEMTIFLVNRSVSDQQNVSVTVNNFPTDGTYSTLALYDLPSDETFVSHTNNALKAGTVTVSNGVFSTTLPALSVTAVVLSKSEPATNYVTLTNRASGLLVDGMGRTSNGDNAGQWSYSGSDAQQWVLETVGNYAKLKNRATGLYLDGMGRTSYGSLVGQWGNSNSYNQQWEIEPYGSYVRIKNHATGLYLDGMYWYSNGSDLGQWGNSGSEGQQWTMTSLKSAIGPDVPISQMDKKDNDILLFPNPFTSEANLRIDNPEQVNSIEIIDMCGELVEVVNHEDVRVNQNIGSLLKSGIYIVQIYSTDKVQSFRLVKK